MAKRRYSWKLKRDAWLLDEAEWAEIAPLISKGIEWIKAYREREGVSLVDAKRAFPDRAGRRYAEMTGECLWSADEIYSVRMADYGAPCPECGKPLRTTRARICLECGNELPDGKRALDFGRLEEF